MAADRTGARMDIGNLILALRCPARALQAHTSINQTSIIFVSPSHSHSYSHSGVLPTSTFAKQAVFSALNR